MCRKILSAALFIWTVQASSLEDVVRCGNGTETSVTLTPSTDGVIGRYTAKLCTHADPGATELLMSLNYYKNRSICDTKPKYIYGNTHSSYIQHLRSDRRCSYICIITTLDVIFSACYKISSWLKVDGYETQSTSKFFNIRSRYTKEYFENNKAYVDIVNHDEDLTVIWHTGFPFESFEVKVYERFNTTADEDEREVYTLNESNCTSPSQLEVRCPMTLKPACYHLKLELFAPWVHGYFIEQNIVRYHYCQPERPDPPVSYSDHVWLWACGALLAVCLCAVAAIVVCRSRSAAALRKRVLHEWTVHSNESTPVPHPVKAGKKHIVLLYARECEAGAKALAQLRKLLQCAGDAQVYDIFTPEVMALAAPAPGEWMRSVLQHGDTRVLLLQTPALAALYRAQLEESDAAVRLQEPLLGRRLMYRAPQYGDTLLQYAVRLTAEAPPAANSYHKYFIATLSELPTEIFPQLVPYRRYPLPTATTLLLRDIFSYNDDAIDNNDVTNDVESFGVAVQEFVDYVKEYPGYLMDELMLV